MSHLGLIIGNAVRRVIGQSTEEELFLALLKFRLG